MGTPAYVRALKLLAGREMPAARLRARLMRQCPAAEVDEALERLRAEGAIDDGRAARRYAETAVRLKGRGRARIERELRELGVDRAIAREALDDVFRDVDERDLIARAIARRLRGRPLRPGDRPRLAAALQRLGFSTEAIAAVLRRHPGAADDPGTGC
jgi:SOS response regulatory protein OraA/RecX